MRAILLGCVTVLSGLITTVVAPAGERPNVVVILLDDLGYSDFGCYGGEIRTPHIDSLAAGGLRFTNFYNAARCCPTRAALLTGQYPHQVGLARNGQSLTRDGATLAELLRQAGYQTAMTGKWHLSEAVPLDGKANSPRHLAWLNHQHDPGRPFADLPTYPTSRGFQRYYGNIWGVVNYFDPFSLVEGTEPVADVAEDYYLTDAITDKSVESIREMAREDRPFFLYVAHCAPHWPLHALPEDIARYRDTYRQGWHELRKQRYRRQIELGLIDPEKYPLPDLMGHGPDWDELSDEQRDHEAALMAVHAAMVDRVDQGVGRIVQALKDTGRYDQTLLLVLSDNGASPERYLQPGYDRPSQTRDGEMIQYAGRFEPGAETTWGYIGSYWSNAANTPLRYWKRESFEGGCKTPLIVHWPQGLKTPPGAVVDQLGHVIDVLPTCLELADTESGSGPGPADPLSSQSATRSGETAAPDPQELTPLAGKSLVPILHGEQRAGHDALFFEHEGGRAVRQGNWKLVALGGGPWELYHLASDATETRNLAEQEPERVAELAQLWTQWARRVGAAVPAERGGTEQRQP